MRTSLRLYPAVEPAPVAVRPADPTPLPFAPSPTSYDASEIAARELIRPRPTRDPARGPSAFSAAWFDELDRKRYARHGSWLPATLEFGRHAGESILVVGTGLGADAAAYHRGGAVVTVAPTAADAPALLRQNLDRLGIAPPVVPVGPGGSLPLPAGGFDVCVWNALHSPTPDPAGLANELYRVLKPGGKVIGLFPAAFDCAFWQSRLLPLYRIHWRRPPDPTTAPKVTARGLRKLFAGFADPWAGKRHLRRGELPHVWRILPLPVLQRLVGRVLVFKAFKPLSARAAVPVRTAA